MANFIKLVIIFSANLFGEFLTGLLTSICPKLYKDPSDKTASIFNTLSRIIPYLIDLPPQLLLPVIPPIVALLDVETSTGKNKP